MAQTRAYLQFFANISEEKEEMIAKLLGEKFGITVTVADGGPIGSFCMANCLIQGLDPVDTIVAEDLFKSIGESLLELSGVEMVNVKDWHGVLQPIVCGNVNAEFEY